MAQKRYGVEQIVPMLRRADIERGSQLLYTQRREEVFSGSTAKVRHKIDVSPFTA